MGVGRPISDAGARGCRPARAPVAGGVQRATLRGEDGRALALEAPRTAAVGRVLPASAALALGRLLRATGRGPSRRAALDSRTLRATPESGERAGYDGAKHKQGSKLHMAVDTLGHLLALHVTPANADDRAQVERLAKAVQVATDDSVEIAFVDQGYTGHGRAPARPRTGGREAARGQARLRAAACVSKRGSPCRARGPL